MAALCYVPYLSVGWGVLGFLSTGYLNEEQFASGDGVWPLAAWRAVAGAMRHDVEVYFAGVTLMLVVMAVLAARHTARPIESSLADVKRMLLAALWLLSPNYPWYFLVVVPFLALSGGATAWAATVGALLLQEEAGWGDFVPLLVRKSILYTAVLLACAYTVWGMLRTARRDRAMRGRRST